MELPPVIQIAIKEELWRFTSAAELKGHLQKSGLLEELKDQAEWTREQFAFEDSSPSPSTGEFIVTPSGSLNPFSSVGKCSNEPCKVELANDFIKTIGIYTTRATVIDTLTSAFTSPEDLIEWRLESLHSNLHVLQKLLPLVKAGVLTFGSPFRHYCEGCHTQVSQTVEDACISLAESADSTIEAKYTEHKKQPLLLLRSPVLNPDKNHPIWTLYRLNKTERVEFLSKERSQGKKKGKQEYRRFISRIYAKAIRSDVKSLFFELDSSRRIHSLLLAGSRIEPLLISHLDGRAPTPTTIENWEALRTVNLPWIQDLNPDEVLQLRESAGTALPRLREMLASTLTQQSSDDVNAISETVASLRAQTFEVEAEFQALNLPKERNYRFGMAGLSMAFVVYGMASAVPALQAGSVAALLATLAHLRNAERDLDNKSKSLMAKPAFALLKAKQILKSRSRT